MRRPARLLAVVAIVATIAPACGARLDSTTHAEAQQAYLNSSGGSAVSGPGGPGGQVSGGTLPGTSNDSSRSSGPTSPGGPSGGPAPGTGPAAPGKGPAGPHSRATNGPQPGHSQGQACSTAGSDVALSSSDVRIGTVAGLTGPVPGLFEGAEQGIEAFAAYANSTGGICGRHVSVSIGDDGTNCTQDENATQSLIGKTFALVGSFALYDGCGARVLKAHPTVPDLHVALDPAALPLPNHFDLMAGRPGYATGPFAYVAHKYGSKVRRVGTIVENVPSAVANQQNFVHAAQSQGWHFVSSILEQPTNSNFQGDFVKMCQQQHIQIFFELTETAQNAATMIQNERQAGCPRSLVNIIPIAYDQAFIGDYNGPKSDLDGILGWSEYSLFFNHDEARRIPELANLQTWFARTYPGQPLNLYAMYAWVEGRLFQEAMDRVRGPVTRRSLLAVLHRIHRYDDAGVISRTNPGTKSTGPHCYILWHLEHGAFSRFADPASGYRCDGHFLAR